MNIHRRRFLSGSVAAALAGGGAEAKVAREKGVKLKLGLNAYSFDKPLRAGTMTLADAVQFCAQNGVDAIDPTGYYFPGYPAAPSDEYVYALKRLAFVNGVAISGTGVRNDFAVSDPAARRKDIQMVKDWIVAASKLGAPVIRVFSGLKRPDGVPLEKAMDWMAADFRECAAFGKEHGVIVGLQHHNDFLKTAAETISLVEAVDSDWFGVILDIGSVREGDPYAEIEKLVPYAVSWQIKDQVWRDGKAETTDLRKIKSIIDRAGYRGYVPFEALGPGDPRPKIVGFLEQIRRDFHL